MTSRWVSWIVTLSMAQVAVFNDRWGFRLAAVVLAGLWLPHCSNDACERSGRADTPGNSLKANERPGRGLS